MRSILVLLLTAIISIPVFAQPGAAAQQGADGAAPRENFIDRLAKRPGVILRKDMTDIGELKNLKLQMVVVTNLEDDQQFKFVRFVYQYKDLNSPDAKAVYVDISGMDELTRGFNNLQSKVFSKTAASYSEVSFKTRDGITGGCIWSKGGWAPYLKLSETDNESYIILEKDDFNKLMSLLDLSRSKILPSPPSKK